MMSRFRDFRDASRQPQPPQQQPQSSFASIFRKKWGTRIPTLPTYLWKPPSESETNQAVCHVSCHNDSSIFYFPLELTTRAVFSIFCCDRHTVWFFFLTASLLDGLPSLLIVVCSSPWFNTDHIKTNEHSEATPQKPPLLHSVFLLHGNLALQ